MKEILESIQNRLMTVNELKYVDEDWGQLSDYSSRPPVKWPCSLIDFASAEYSNIGIDKSATPRNRQQATGAISITFANLKITNTSGKAPVGQKNDAWQLHEVIEVAHGILQGFKPTAHCGALVRSGFRRVKRDDGIQQYQVIYTMGIHNV